MSLESNLAKLADVNTRIAVALEAIAQSQGIVSGEAEAAAKPAAEKKAPGKKKAAKKTASKKAPAKKAAEKPASKIKLTIKDDVRPTLKRLRDEVSHDAVKALLKKYDATTIQQLDEKDYINIIKDAQEDLE